MGFYFVVRKEYKVDPQKPNNYFHKEQVRDKLDDPVATCLR
jgi:hypothetical protein